MNVTTLLLIGLLVTGAQEVDWDRYLPGTITETLEALNLDKQKTVIIEEIPLKARVVYRNSSRKIAPAKSKFLDQWFREHGLPQEQRELFVMEAEIFEGGKSYWIPLQQTLLDDLRGDSAKFPAPIDVYVILIGFENGEAVLLMNAYDDFFGQGEQV